MNKRNDPQSSLDERVRRFAQYLPHLRKAQDKKDSEFLASLGNLSIQELNILNIIGDSEPCIMRDIAKQAALSLSSITVIVDKLVKAKLALRLRNDIDRRIVYASLTPEGKKVYQIQIQHLHQFIHKMLAGLTLEEQDSLLRIMEKVVRSLM